MSDMEITQIETTTPVLPSLLAQKVELDKQITKAKAEEKAAVLAHIRSAMEQYEITAEELTAAPKRGRKPGSTDSGVRKPVAPKYQDPVSGATWTGRGKKPLFIREAEANGTLENCRIV